MNYPLGLHPGTKWYRSDLQVHSPRDVSWMGPEVFDSDPEQLDAVRSAWAKSLVDFCVAAQPPITAIAITDHHDVCFAMHVREAAQGSALLVYPGVEVTCSDNAQCLVLFEPSATEATLQRLLGALPGVPSTDHSASKGPRITHAGVTVEELAARLEKDEALRGKCLLLPHFGDGTAHKTLNTQSTGPRFAALVTEGVYVEKAFAELDAGTINKVRGLIPDWGTRRRGVLVTGDNKSPTFDRVAFHPCWIKLGEPTIEALRQALLADEARISFGLPSEPSERIVELEVQSSLTGDAPLRVSFNAGFSAIVGGRGTGKSALLEYLRFGLGRTEGDIDITGTGTEAQAARSREVELIEDTLVGGFVRLTLDREGVREVWRRDLATRDTIEATDQAGNVTRLTLDAARERFRARAFNQKGLSSLTSNQAVASDQITGIAAAEALARRREIDRAINNAKREVGTSLQQVVSHWQAELERQQAHARAQDLTERLASVNGVLSRGGVSPEHLATIEKAGLQARAKSFLDVLAESVTSRREAVPVESPFPTAPTTLSAEEFPHVAALTVAIEKAQSEIAAAYQRVRDAVDALGEAVGAAKEQQARQEEALAASIAEANEAQQAQRALIDDARRLSSELAEAEQSYGRAASRAEETKAFEVGFRKAQRELTELVVERRSVLAAAAEQVAGQSSGLLKARLSKDRSPRQYISALLRLTEASHITDAEQKCSDWVTQSVANDSDAWAKIAAELLGVYQFKIASGSPTEPGGEVVSRIRSLFFGDAGLTERQATRIYANLSDSTLSDVLAAVPQDQIVLTYQDASGRDMAFGMASPGQQASALLELLLRQSAGTLIIDQPEDDLDNRVIMKIVELIRTSKSNRQLIFTTHNPNIVVNGDADKVIALRTREAGPGGKYSGPMVSLQLDGAIETSEIREYITSLIEGGKDAFDLRSRKYGYEAPRPQVPSTEVAGA